MKKILFLLTFILTIGSMVYGQGADVFRLNATTNGTTVSMATVGGAITLRDDDSQGQGAPDEGYPMRGIDYSITVEGNCTDDVRLVVFIGRLSVYSCDTVYIYDGASTSSPLIKKFNSYYGGVHENDYIFVTPTNTSNKITVRFRTGSGGDNNSDGVGKGFEFNVHCRKPCESIVPVINSTFYRVRNGVIYDSSDIREVVLFDTVYIDEENPSLGIDHIDTNRFMGAHLCIGDAVIFRGHGEYSHNYGYYNPSDATSYFIWDMANDGDTLKGTGLCEITYADYQKTGCYDMVLDITDVSGCSTDLHTSIKVRTSANPIKTIFTLADICNSDALRVNMGYSGENATLTLREIENNETVSKVFESVTFIPDGCTCTQPNYFEAPVTFTEFSNSSRISHAKDICSVCINMEHTFMGDIYITLVCPTGQEAILKFGNPVQCGPEGLPRQAPTEIDGHPIHGGGENGSGTHLGWATHDDGNMCRTPSDYAPWDNPYGIGLDYCFSRNGNYTLVGGVDPSVVTANERNPSGPYYLASSGAPTVTSNDPVWGLAALTGNTSLPACAPYVDAAGTSHPFTRGGVPGPGPSLSGSTTRKPSNHENKSDYYLPFSDFSELVGCPLNGTWKVRVYDTFNQDNGWIFNWSMDICGVSQDDDCKYIVGIDSLVWKPDPAPQYHDYDMGHYRGLEIEQATPTVSYISSPDTAGTFPIDVFIYDEFGCVWDTNTRITTYWTPEPHLGADTTLCGVDQTVLDARDRHTLTENYTYIWAPYGQNTPTIETTTDAHGDITYVALVENRRSVTCRARDTINVALRKQPLPNFTPEPFTFEGCDPLTITFNNQTIDAASHLWVFGDGVTSELASPTHTYAEGQYTLKYYATSDEGCVDSIISPGGISVYSKPKAAFSWEPVYPSVANPTVQFINETQPQTPNVHYFWEIQYDSDYPLSFETLTTKNPSFNFANYSSDNDPSGNYAISLIARTENMAPSGNRIYCADTASNNILIINDFLQFPNVVTPNGDGINDRFVIQNLVNGLGYPNNTLDIYNRWGTRVYHKENISSDDDFWDPSDMPAGTYFYRFSARGYNGNIEHNGSIEVIK